MNDIKHSKKNEDEYIAKIEFERRQKKLKEKTKTMEQEEKRRMK